MNKKAAQHLNMTKAFMFLQLADKQVKATNHAVSLYEDTHGFGFHDDYDERDYERFTKEDGEFKRLWHEACTAMDEWRTSLGRFCDAMVKFTDGQIDYKTARTMATNPRLAKKLEAIMMGGIA